MSESDEIWRVRESGDPMTIVSGPNDDPVCDVICGDPWFIVRAVNNHEALVAMVQKLRLRCNDLPTFDEAENLLAEILK